jgi:hypothetical protein
MKIVVLLIYGFVTLFLGFLKVEKKSINKFAIMIILLIAVPEIVGHSLFDKPHPVSSSVTAAISLTNKLNKTPKDSPVCRLALENDPSGASIARASGLQGQYGNYTCS